MRTIDLLDLLYDEIDNSPKAIIGNKRMIEAEKLIQIISDIKKALPTELDRAVNIIRERKEIMFDAEKEASQLLNEARRHADEMVANTEIVKRAEQESRSMIDQARQHAKEIRLASINFADRMLDDLERSTKSYTAQIQKNREQLDEQFSDND